MAAGERVGTVAELRRHPVKSTTGESVTEADVTPRGLRHDREWAAYTADGGIASGKRTRRFRPVPGLLRWSSTVEGGVTYLVSPEGSRLAVDDAETAATLGAALGQPLALRREQAVAHFDDCPVHVVTTSAVAALEALAGRGVDVRRFRANVVVDTGAAPGFPEDHWVEAAELALGPEVVLRVGPPMPRCVMVDQHQAGVAVDGGLLRLLGERRETAFGVQAHVLRGGTLRTGDEVRRL